MAEAALDAVRRELREFPAAARGEWVHAEAAAASPRPPGSLTTRAGPWACGEPGPRVGRALTLLGRRHHGSREFVSSRSAGARAPDSLPAPLPSLFCSTPALAPVLSPQLPCSSVLVAFWSDSSPYSQGPRLSAPWCVSHSQPVLSNGAVCCCPSQPFLSLS